ncbi:MAG: hypothetical protein KAI47_10420 [Deltaproteobacteria bacterium]|nr:hypothetical protein [Deltaproteobacteria bacterium]
MHRKWLYLGGLLFLVGIVLLAGLSLLLLRFARGVWALPMWAGALTATTWTLSRTKAGRGCLRSVGLGGKTRKFEPNTQVVIEAIVFAVLIAFAIVSTAL